MAEHDRPTGASAIEKVAESRDRAGEGGQRRRRRSRRRRACSACRSKRRRLNIGDYVMWGSIGIVAAVGQLVLILFLVYFSSPPAISIGASS